MHEAAEDRPAVGSSSTSSGVDILVSVGGVLLVSAVGVIPVGVAIVSAFCCSFLPVHVLVPVASVGLLVVVACYHAVGWWPLAWAVLSV